MLARLLQRPQATATKGFGGSGLLGQKVGPGWLGFLEDPPKYLIELYITIFHNIPYANHRYWSRRYRHGLEPPAALCGQALILETRTGIRPELNGRGSKAPVQVTPARQRPPVVEKDLERPPVRDPAKDKQALFDQPLNRIFKQVSGGKSCGDEARYEDRDSDGQRAPADPEQLIEVVLDGNSAALEIVMKCRVQLVGVRGPRIAVPDTWTAILIGRLSGSSRAQPTMYSSAS